MISAEEHAACKNEALIDAVIEWRQARQRWLIGAKVTNVPEDLHRFSRACDALERLAAELEAKGQ